MVDKRTHRYGDNRASGNDWLEADTLDRHPAPDYQEQRWDQRVRKADNAQFFPVLATTENY